MVKKETASPTKEQSIAALKSRIAELEIALDAAYTNIERYHSAIQNAPDVLLSINRHGKILFSNEAPSGLSIDEMVGKNIFEIIASDDHREKLRHALEHVFRTGETTSYEHIDGEGKWHATRVSPIYKDGVIISATVIGRNIDTEKTLEKERARLLEAEREQRELAEALREAGIAFSSTLDLDAILTALLDQIKRVVPYDAGNVMVVEGGIARISQARGYEHFGDKHRDDIEGLCFEIKNTFNLRTMFESGRPLIIPNTANDPHWVHVRKNTEIRSWAGAPITVQGEVVAFFSLDKRNADFYQPADADRLSAFAGQAAVAIKNARLFQDVRSALRRTQALQHVSEQLIAKNTLTSVLQSVVDSIAEALPAHTVILSALNIESRDIAYFVKGGPGAHKIDNVTFDQLKNDLTKWLKKGYAPRLLRPQLESFLPKGSKQKPPKDADTIEVPLRYQNTVLGTLVAINIPGNSPYTEAETELMAAMANQAAVAIQNVYWHEESQKQGRLVQQILDTVSLGIFLLDDHFRIQMANPPARRFLAKLQTIEQDSGALTALGTLPLTSLLQLETEHVWPEISPPENPDRIFTVSAHSVNNGWVIVLNDISDARKQQRRAQQQERLAAIGQMASGFAHDFNNILTSMIGFADLLSRNPNLDAGPKRQLLHIVSQGQRAAELITQLLDFSRQSSSHMRQVLAANFLLDMVQRLQNILPPTIDISVTIDPSAKTSQFQLDTGRIQQVFFNLARNAQDAMPNGGKIHLSASRLLLTPNEPAPYPTMPIGAWIVLSIQDTGTGIPADILPHVFEPFFTTKEVGAGTGLGLSQAYGIMKQHDGYITVNSENGTGTTVSLYFPEIGAEEYRTENPPSENEHLSKEILLVEDELGSLSAGKSLLEKLGYFVVTAQDGYTALAEFDAHEETLILVLMDTSLAGLGGDALGTALKERNASIPIVGLTSSPLSPQTLAETSETISEWLTKPLTEDAVKTLLANISSA